MGKCASTCFGIEGSLNKTSLRKVSYAYPAPLLKFPKIIPSDRHDEKFYFIHKEEEIDKIINQLDEAIDMNEHHLSILEKTLADLKAERNKLSLFPEYDSDDFLTRHENDEIETSLLEPKSGRKCSTKKTPLRAHTLGVSTDSSITMSGLKREVKQGALSIEVQKAQFYHPRFIERSELSQPYVVIKIYYMEKAREKGTAKYNSKGVEIAKFETSKAKHPLKIEWDQLFEQVFDEEEKKVSSFSFGFTFFYSSNKGKTDFQVGDEQIFSIGSLLDQVMQVKYIELTEPDLKGLLGRIRVRFQFIYDAELIKERMLRDIKAKIEKLIRVKKRHHMFSTDRKRMSKMSCDLLTYKASIDRKFSEAASLSSTHDNEDTGYYLA